MEHEFWWENVSFVKQSAFDPYQSRPVNELQSENCGNGSIRKNMNKRMIEFLTRNNGNVKIKDREQERRRCYKHMISERIRRENLKQNYLALHRMLPFGTKNEKILIVQTAMVEIKEMEKYKEELLRRNQMLEARLVEKEDGDRAKIRLKVANPSSGIDYMIGVGKCLMDLGLKATYIHSHFSDSEFSAELEIQKQVEVEEVEKAIQRRLIEVERKHALSFHQLYSHTTGY